MDFQTYFPVWDQLTRTQQNKLSASLICRKAEKDTELWVIPAEIPIKKRECRKIIKLDD